MENNENVPIIPPVEPKSAEVHHHHYHNRDGFNFGKLFFGIILVIIGLLYLAKSSGWPIGDVYFDWQSFWPLLFVLLGLSMLSAKTIAGKIFGTILTLLILAAIIFVLFTPGFNRYDGQPIRGMMNRDYYDYYASGSWSPFNMMWRLR